MITYNPGNLLMVTRGVIIHGCNAQGVMGSGVALAIREKYPSAYRAYANNLSLELGTIIWYEHTPVLKVANAITQEFYGVDGKRYVNYSALAKCFDAAIKGVKQFGLEELHFPKIGAGLGGGDWSIIEQIINDTDPYDKVKKICWTL